MTALLKLIWIHKLDGLKELIKLKLGRIPFMRLKKNKIISIYISVYKPIIYLRENTSDYSTFKQIFLSKEYDIDYNFSPRVIIDAGANVGMAAVFFSELFPKAIIYSIEPEKSNFIFLKKNTKSYPKVICMQNALHHTANEILDILDEGIGKWGFVTKASSHGTDINTIVSKVKTVSIRSILKDYEIDVIDILKVDIEGAEIALFELDYEYWLSRTRCIVIELHDRFYPGCEERVFNVINKFNFHRYKKGENWVFFNNSIK